MARKAMTVSAAESLVPPDEQKQAAQTKANAKAQSTQPEKDIASIDLSTFTSKSAKMRKLHVEGFSTSAIAKHLNVKYQFVRNVLVSPPPKNA